MELILAATCEGAHERPDGRLDLVGVFDELSAPGFPARQDSLTVVFVMEWRPEEAGRQEFRADLVHENGTKVLTIEGHTDVSAEGRVRPRTRLLMPMERVVFPVEGRYRFHLTAGGRTIPALSLHLSKAPAQDG